MNTRREVDLTGLKCPMPIVKLNKVITELGGGSEFTAIADDPAFGIDVEAWCKKTGHVLVHFDDSDKRLVATIRKSEDPVG